MKVLITGSLGFVGKNLVSTLEYMDEFEILTFNRADDISVLEKHSKVCDFVVHLAGVNRPEKISDFYTGNVDLVSTLISFLKKHNNKAPILVSSSIQAELDNDYGKSKKAGEDVLIEYGKEVKSEVLIYRLPNLFGKWTRPFYNSVVATWAHQISRDEEVEISNPDNVLHLVYIDDLVKEIIAALNMQANKVVDNYYSVPISYKISLGELLDLFKSFRESRNTRFIANMKDDLTSKLYSTYLNYLPRDKFSYPLVTHSDKRGSFSEFIKSDYAGQVSINVSTAHQIKGEHWHHSKNEKFLVVKGKASIKFRDIFEKEVVEYIVSDKKLEVVDIPTGYTHNITNLSKEDLITIMWVNEPYNPNNPDTFVKMVEEDQEGL
ncbi:MAG: SDR family oxidoreductase [Erysipelothrix sp.]|nr:SDR family oxidoreductase [Erysipelothrix sp.]